MARAKKERGQRGHKFSSGDAKRAGKKGGRAGQSNRNQGYEKNQLEEDVLTDQEIEDLASDTRWADDDI